jgi:predicted GNAT family acetyltransferase
MILGRHESIQASATLENAFNKLKRNLIRLVHPDKVPSIKGEGVDDEVVKKDFEEASTAINVVIDQEIA